MLRNVKNGRRTVVKASNVMVGDELLMAGEPNVFVESIQHFSTRYRTPSHVVLTWRTPKGRPVARTYDANDTVSIYEVSTTHAARRSNSRNKTSVLVDGIRRENGVFPVRCKVQNPTCAR
jgi:hypothetical protein